ncbi:MAG: cysteine desulfurase family protein [Verrucomicrobiota bacterium]
MLYLDANATTPPDPLVVEEMLPFLIQHYGNASASHAGGRRARRAVEKARGQVASLVGAQPEEIIFTSGATESINSVLSFAQQEWPERPLLITSAVEHAAVVECADRWEQRGGRVKRVPVNEHGVIRLDALKTALEPGKTALVSMIWANNETGVISPMAEIAAMAHEAGSLVHADAVQMAGKAEIEIKNVPVDYLSLSGHKMHAIKGIGALFVSRHAPFRPLLIGGGQESGRRSGTENVPGIVAMGKAAELASSWLQSGRPAEMADLRDEFEQLLMDGWPGAMVHGADAPRLPNTTSISLPGADAAGMLIVLDQRGIACSGGSACHTASLHPSHVLEAMGHDATHAGSTLRFSTSRMNTRDEVISAVTEVLRAARHLTEQKGLLA